MSNTVHPTPQSTPYEYVGETMGLGSLELTEYAQSYAETWDTDLSDFFPDENIIPRTVVIETMKSSLGLMTMVDMGMPDAAQSKNDRIERRIVEPAVFRESDFLDEGFINQIRDYENKNQARSSAEIIRERVRNLVDKRNRTLDFFRAQVLLGGINHTDPNTGAVCNVSTQVPAHNFFSYNGYNDSASAGGVVSTTHNLRAFDTLTNSKGRPEALMFQNTDGEAGVPWTHPRADILKSLYYILAYLKNTNKNMYSDILMTEDLRTVLMQNELIKAYQGKYGFFNFAADGGNSGTAAQGQNIITSSGAAEIGFGPGGVITSLAGLNVVTVDNLYLDPISNKHIKMWPVNKVALVARSHMNSPSQTLGRTVHPVAEGPGQQPGLWMYSSDVEYNPPLPPGRSMQIGDAFIPYARYPQWISLLTVAEEDDVFANQILRADLDFGLAF